MLLRAEVRLSGMYVFPTLKMLHSYPIEILGVHSAGTVANFLSDTEVAEAASARRKRNSYLQMKNGFWSVLYFLVCDSKGPLTIYRVIIKYMSHLTL